MRPEALGQRQGQTRHQSQAAGLIFKGSGFYITDYRSEKYKEAAKKDAAPASAPAPPANPLQAEKASLRQPRQPTSRPKLRRRRASRLQVLGRRWQMLGAVGRLQRQGSPARRPEPPEAAD